MVYRRTAEPEVQELVAITALPVTYFIVAPVLSVTPVHDPVMTVGTGLVAMLIMIGLSGAWHLRPRRRGDGRMVLPTRGHSPFRLIWRRAYRQRGHWLRGLFLMVLALLFLDFYAGYKQAIPRFAEYGWDPLLSDVDRIIHGGVYPWELLRPLVESEAAIRAFDTVYWLWAIITLSFVAVMAWSWDRRRRVRFMLTFFATWIFGGTVLATAFASGGPVYFHHFAPDVNNPYEPLIHTLREMGDLWAVQGHDLLLTGFTTGGHPRASGISAMPSLHVAIATLCVLVGRTFHRRLGIVTAVYGCLIVIGSVVLAWHYAIDAYVSIALVMGLWWLAGRLVDRIVPPQRQEASLAGRVPGTNLGASVPRAEP